MTLSNRIILGSLTAAAALLGVAGCSRGSATPSAPPPPEVTVAPVEQEEVVEWHEFTGRTDAMEIVEVQPRISGHIQEVRFQSGQLVKKGDVLFVIDPRWHQAEYDRREAEYEQARVHLRNAERETARTELLLEKRAISTEEAESRASRHDAAKAALLAAEAARNSAKLDLESTLIRSPIDGRVSRALVTAGNYVSGVAGMTTVLTTIVSVDPIYVYADVDENTLLRLNAAGLREQASVELGLGDEEAFPHQGRIESFDNRVDPQTGSILLRAVFPNSDGRIVPGLFARIRLRGGDKYSALLIDERAIGTDQARKFVMALTSTNTVEYRPVELGPMIDGRRVVRSGVSAGDQVVVNGLQRVRPGMPVQPQRADAANAAGRVQTALR